jgi:penicillin-binding protein 1A
VDKNKVKTKRVFSESIGEQMREIMHGVVMSGTGVEANVTQFAAGKTGTTENYGDAWFVGFTDKLTVAVWVGYPDKLKYMKTEFHGGPVAGGTYPAQIWHDFMTSAISIDQQRHPNQQQTGTSTTPSYVAPPSTSTPSAPATTAPSAPATQAPQNGGGNNAPQQPQRQQAPQQPATPPQPTPQGGGGGGGNGGGGGSGGPGGGTAPHP